MSKTALLGAGLAAASLLSALITRAPVQSSNIAAVGYDPEARVLEVEFTSGAVYRYGGVPAQAHQALMQSDSIGGHFARHIRNHFTHDQMPVFPELP